MSRIRLFNRASLIFILCHVILLAFNWKNYPTEIDTPFHLLMGKLFSDSGKVALWDSYEFAPMGRPNLYPPLEHILVWFLHSLTRVSWLDVGRIIVFTQSVLGLLCVWFFSKKFFNEEIAFFALIFFASNTENWWWQTSVAPVSLITVLFLPFIFCFYKKKVLASILILTACFYLHYGLSFALILTVFLASLFSAGYRKEFLKNFFIITAASIALFSPWLLHIFRYRDTLASFLQKQQMLLLLPAGIYWPKVILKLNIVLWIFAIMGAVWCVRRKNEDFRCSLFFAGFLSYFIFLFFYQGIRFSAHSPVVNSVVASLGFCVAWDKAKDMRRNRGLEITLRSLLFFLISFSVLFELHWATPRVLKAAKVEVDTLDMGKNELIFRSTPLLNEAAAVAFGIPLRGKDIEAIQCIFNSLRAGMVIEYLASHVPRDTVIHMNNAEVADTITLLTGIKTDTGMYWETITPELIGERNERRRSGLYVSHHADFHNLLPSDYVKERKFPKVIKVIQKIYIGVL